MAKIINSGLQFGADKYQELKEKAAEIESNFRWIRYNTREAVYVPLNDNPICIGYLRDEMPLSEDPRDKRVVKVSPEVSDDTLISMMTQTKCCLSYPVGSATECYPVAPTALRGVYERVGLACPVMTSTGSSSKRDEASPYNKALAYDVLRRYSKGDTLIRVGDEMIRGNLSEDYVVIPFPAIISATEEVLYDSFEMVDFANGNITYETASIEYNFFDADTFSELCNAFKRAGIDVSEYLMSIKVLTSDVGLSGVNIYPFIRSTKDSSSFLIGTPIKMNHVGEASIDLFKENLRNSFSSFKSVPKILDELTEIEIKNPADCLYNIGKKAGLPEKSLTEACEDFDGEYPLYCRGVDIYAKLFDIFFNSSASTKDDLSVITATECITRACFISLKKYDEPVVKGGKVVGI